MNIDELLSTDSLPAPAKRGDAPKKEVSPKTGIQIYAPAPKKVRLVQPPGKEVNWDLFAGSSTSTRGAEAKTGRNRRPDRHQILRPRKRPEIQWVHKRFKNTEEKNLIQSYKKYILSNGLEKSSEWHASEAKI